jgi:hypothetical protein
MTSDSPPTGRPAAEHPSLFALLSARARRASDGRLVADAAVGTALLAVIFVLNPSLWLLAMPLAALAAFGLWGIADREAAEHSGQPRARRLFSTIRFIALLLGMGAAAVFVLGAMAVLLGTWIS